MKTNKYKGVITLEASLVLPVFIFVIYFFLFFYEVIMVQDLIHREMTQECRTYSSYGSLKELISAYVNEEDQVINYIADSLIMENVLELALKDKLLIDKCIEGRVFGLSCMGSSFSDEEECVTLQVNYKIAFPVFQAIVQPVACTQKVRMRLFNGYAVPSRFQDEEEEEDGTKEQYVYMTEHGKVYHTNHECSYLKITVQKVPSDTVNKLRNKSGAKYYPCSKCCAGSKIMPEYIYVTQYGTHYHIDPKCYEISRTIKKVPLAEVSGMRECKRCKSAKKSGE